MRTRPSQWGVSAPLSPTSYPPTDAPCDPPTTVGLDLAFEDPDLEREFLDHHQHAQISWDVSYRGYFRMGCKYFSKRVFRHALRPFPTSHLITPIHKPDRSS